MSEPGRPTATYRWWLRLQLALLLAGGITWLIGAAVEEDFVTGAGAGMLVGALALRLGRRAARDSPHRDDGDALHRREETTPTADAPPAPDGPPASDAGEGVP